MRTSDGIQTALFYEDHDIIVIGKYKIDKAKAFFFIGGARSDIVNYKFLSKTEDYPTTWKATNRGETPGPKAVMGAHDVGGHRMYIAERNMGPDCEGSHIGYYIPAVEPCARIQCSQTNDCFNDFNLLYIDVWFDN